MSSVQEPHLHLEVGHILFLDIVGYSKLLADEQKELVQELNQIVRETEQFRAAEAEGKLTRLPTGDGMVLVFTNNPEAPVECALEISKALQSHPKLRVRMGIHSGPVNPFADVNDQSNLAGAGINVAQRVMYCGDAGHILLSKHFAEDLEHYAHWRSHLHDVGEVTGKHGLRIPLVNLYTDQLGNSALPAKWRQARAAFRVKSAAVAALFLIAALGVAFLMLRRSQEKFTNAAEAIPYKSIAVLPFENRSEDKANAYFADGIQDEILTSLSKIATLKVIARTSTQQYQTKPRNLSEIAKQLGVAHVLEGSVQKSGDVVRVNVQLIKASDDSHLWADTFDRKLTDIFSVESEIAKAIADQLRAKLSPREKARIEEVSTANAEAYVFDLRANQILQNPDSTLEDYKAAEQLYMQAIYFDPNFALAHARLASTRAAIFHYYEPTESWRIKARTEAEAALHLQPNLAEAHLALGQCIYWIDQDYDRALEQLDIASRVSPSNVDARRLIAAIKRRQGKWEQSLEEYERVERLDPQNPNTVRELIFTNTAMHRWPEAARWVEQLRAMVPASIVMKIQSGYVDFWWKGDTALLKSILNQVSPDVDPDGAVSSVRWDVAMLDRDYAAARRAIEASTVKELSYRGLGSTPRSFFEGCTALAQGDIKGAQKYFQEAQPVFENAVKEAPLSALRHANLGWLYAFIGRKEDAIREGRRAVELKPESKDAVDGVIVNCYLALIYARVGERDLAFPLLERLLKTPGAVDSVGYSITINDLKRRWEWDVIRGDPRFQKLISSSSP
jgi:TolB-like protein/Tfp pilus assembly protein PilF